MKNLFLLLFITLTFNSIYSQVLEIDPDSEKYISQGVVEFENLKTDKIYNSALEWVTLKYNSANDVIQLKDKELNKIILKGNFSSSMFGKQGWIHHTLILEFKDDRFRYTYTDFAYDSAGSGEMQFEGKMFSKKKIISSTESDISDSIESLTAHIKKQKKEDKW